MGDAEKLIVGILAAIIVLVLGFFVIRSIFPKKTASTTTTKQVTPTVTPSLLNGTPTPTISAGQGSTNSGNNNTYPSAVQPQNGYTTVQYSQSQSGTGSAENQGTQSQSQPGSGQNQTQTLPNGMTQTQNQ